MSKGARGIDGSKGEDFLTTKAPFEKGAERHSIATREFKEACSPWDEDTWKPGKVSSSPKKGGRNTPSDTSPVEAASPTGRFAKKGGSGQRSGS